MSCTTSPNPKTETYANDQENQRLDFFCSKESWTVFFWAAGISSLVYLSYVVLPLYAIDDYFLYQLYQIDSSTMGYNFYSTGRFSQLILADFFQLLNIQPLTKPIGPILFILSLSYLSVILSNAVDVKGFFLKLGFSLLVILNPFMAELFHYSVIPAYSAFAMLSLTLGFVYGSRFAQCGSRLDLAFSIVMYAVSLSIYQIFYPIIFVFILFQIAISYVDFTANKPNVIKQQFKSLIPYFSAFIFYSVVLNTIFLFYPPSLTYSGTSFSDLIMNLTRHEYWSALNHNLEFYILKDNPFNSFTLNSLMWVFFLFSLMVFTFTKIIQCKSWSSIKRPLIIIVVLILVNLLGLVGCLGFSILRPAEISSRSVTAFGVYQALTVITSFYLLQYSGVLEKYRIGVSAVIIGILVLGSAGRIGRVALDQYRLNSFDKSLATRIVTRLESFPDFTPNAKLVILGAPTMGSLSRTSFGDYNISALQHFSRVFVINEISGYSFQNPNSDDIKSASMLVQDRTPWPNESSVISNHGTFIVLLAK